MKLNLQTMKLSYSAVVKWKKILSIRLFIKSGPSPAAFSMY